MIKNGLFLTILILILIVSCDYEANEHYRIDNKSKFDIQIAFVKKYGNDKHDTTKLIVNANDSRDFYVNKTATAVSKGKGDNYLDIFDTVKIYINDTLILNKDLYVMDNWDYWHKGNRDSESKFTFIITDSDLKKR